MGEPATAMRDPVFYRFHAFTDDVFLEHKNTLPEYNLRQVGVHSCLAFSRYIVGSSSHITPLSTCTTRHRIARARARDLPTIKTIFEAFKRECVCRTLEFISVSFS